MSVSKYRPHVMILPEDSANRQLANGFVLHEAVRPRSVQVLPEAGGWHKVRDQFQEEHTPVMLTNPLRHMVLLVDFDGRASRFSELRSAVPDSLTDRVFVVGVWTEPEDLFRYGLPGKEDFGLALANECFENRRAFWNHELLQHNAAELARMTSSLKPVLFP